MVPYTSRAPAEAAPMPRPADITGALFTVGEQRVGRRAVLSVAGEVDISTAADLQAAIEIAGTGAFEIWVDLSDTTFMDSSGLHAMVRARACLTDANRRLALICPEGPVLRLLTLTGLDRIFEIHAGRSEANAAAPGAAGSG
jgi:anti-sigma B factor antagonist